MEENTEKIASLIKNAERQEIDLLIFPELVISGYPPRDLLYYDNFVDQVHDKLSYLANLTDKSTVVIGSPYYDKENECLRNAAVVMSSGSISEVIYKVLLPDYDVFDESRYFKAVPEPKVVTICGIEIGIQICEDAWDNYWYHEVPVTKLQSDMGAELIINISASPFTINKPANRLKIVKDHVKENGIPFIYLNLIGGQDEIVFDGRSFVVNSNGELTYVSKKFDTEISVHALEELLSPKNNAPSYELREEKEWLNAIQLNLNDYLAKSNLNKKLLVAISGGIDSALTATLAAQAVGNNNVIGVFMPAKFSSSRSYKDAKQLAENLGIEFLKIDIEKLRNEYSSILQDIDRIDEKWNVADENIQPRIRANIMMYLSNKLGHIVLATGNKSEIAVGYSTLYGDTVGAIALIGDLYKSQVYSLSKYLNEDEEIIPQSIIDRTPSAELKENQQDTDTLPQYEILDQILKYIVDDNMSTEEIVRKGFDKKTVEKVSFMITNSEFKRRQLPFTVKVSNRAFGYGRRMPVANQYNI